MCWTTWLVPREMKACKSLTSGWMLAGLSQSSGRVGLADDPDGETEGFEQVVIVVRSGRVLGGLGQLVGEGRQELGEEGDHGLLQSRERPHHRLHDVLVLTGPGLVERREKVLQKIFRQRSQFIGLDQSLPVSVLHDEDLVNGGGRVGVDHHGGRGEELDEGREGGLDSLRRELRSEDHYVLDTVRLHDRDLVHVTEVAQFWYHVA